MIKLKIAQMREQFGLPEYDGNLDKLRLNIMSIKSRLGFNYNPVVEKEPEPEPEPEPVNTVPDKIDKIKDSLRPRKKMKVSFK
jgi:hypothetical protein